MRPLAQLEFDEDPATREELHERLASAVHHLHRQRKDLEAQNMLVDVMTKDRPNAHPNPHPDHDPNPHHDRNYNP